MRSKLVLPRPPSVNALFANVPGKGRVRTKRYRMWANVAGWDIKAQRPKPVHGPVCIDFTFERPKAPKSDASNFIKAVEDLLVTHGLIDDDSLIEEGTYRWGNVNGVEVSWWPHV